MPHYVSNSKGISEELGIHVQRGSDLVNKDFVGLSDPYVVVKMGKQVFKKKKKEKITLTSLEIYKNYTDLPSNLKIYTDIPSSYKMRYI